MVRLKAQVGDRRQELELPDDFTGQVILHLHQGRLSGSAKPFQTFQAVCTRCQELIGATAAVRVPGGEERA